MADYLSRTLSIPAPGQSSVFFKTSCLIYTYTFLKRDQNKLLKRDTEHVGGMGRAVIELTVIDFLIHRRDFQCFCHTLQRAHQSETWSTLLRYVVNLLSRHGVGCKMQG